TALGLYLSGMRKNDSRRMVAAFACLAIAMLVHYSVAPIAVFLVAHYVVFFLRDRRSRWLELCACVAISASIFATWIGWSLYSYGWIETFASNSTVLGSQKFSLLENLLKLPTNTINTIVPFFFRGRYESSVVYMKEAPTLGLPFLRDWCFVVFQVT